MERAPSQSRVLKFGVFEVDLEAGELRKAGMRQKLAGQPLQVLQVLLERPQQIVTREELQHRIWPKDTFVDYDLALKKAVNRVREVLGDSAESPRFIETIPRRGYRFIAPLTGNGAVPTVARLPTEVVSTDTGRSRRSLRVGILLGLGVLVLLLALLGFAPERLWERLSGKNATPQIRSLAVLPLQSLSGDPAQEYFSDGMTDALITDLAQIGSLKVISRTSTMHYKKTDRSLPEIARELNVDGIIEGTVQRSGDRVRITAQLIYGPSDKHVWANSYERDMRDVLGLQKEVAQSIATAVQIRLTGHGSTPAASLGSVDPEAYDAYLKGRYEWNKRDPADLQRALDFFQQAIARDRNYAPAYAGLADAFVLMGAAGYDVLPVSEAMEKGRSAALEALQMDDTLSEAHASLAFIMYSYEWKWEAAEKEFQRALSLNSGNATAHQWYSEYLADLGRWDESKVQAKAALMLDPLSLIINENMARPYYFSREFDQAIKASQETLRLDEGFPIAHLRLGRAYAAKGMFAEAIGEFQRFSKLTGGSTLALASLSNVRGRMGNRHEALAMIADLKTLAKHKRVPAYQFAIAYVGVGDADQAIEWLNKAYNERSDFLVCSKVEPLFDTLHSDPRFHDLIHRVGLPE